MAERRIVDVPAREGRALRLSAGRRFRAVDLEGGQVADTFAFSADDLSEYHSAEHHGPISRNFVLMVENEGPRICGPLANGASRHSNRDPLGAIPAETVATLSIFRHLPQPRHFPARAFVVLRHRMPSLLDHNLTTPAQIFADIAPKRSGSSSPMSRERPAGGIGD